jgi:hypothetical protein
MEDVVQERSEIKESIRLEPISSPENLFELNGSTLTKPKAPQLNQSLFSLNRADQEII